MEAKVVFENKLCAACKENCANVLLFLILELDGSIDG